MPRVEPSNTLPQLDGVVITVAPDADFSGEVVVIDENGVLTDGDELDDLVVVDSSDDDTGQDGGNGSAPEGGADADAADAPDDPPERNPLGGDDPEDKLMPDVVCFGLQDAQDEIQDRGVFFSKSVDATGDGRRQLFDRNWIVVSQTPSPGTPIGENEAVLSVVKKDEPNDC